VSLIAKFTVPPDSFALAETIAEFPGLIGELGRVVPANDNPMPYLWTNGTEVAAVSAALEDDATVEEITVLDELNGDQLYRITWTGDVEEERLIGGFEESEVTLLRAETEDSQWLLEMRFDSRESLASFQSHCDDHDIECTLTGLYQLEQPKLGQYNLTIPQREVLATALELGYFQIPRQTTMSDIADELGVTANAVSERLRRAQANLISNTVTIGQSPAVGRDEGLPPDIGG